MDAAVDRTADQPVHGGKADPLLAVRELRLETRSVNPIRLLDGVSFSVDRGDVLALVGESGCGKTLACLAVLGLQPASLAVVSGSVRLAGREIAGQPDRLLQPLRGRRIAMIFQDPSSALNPVQRIGSTLITSLRRHRGLGEAAARAEASRLLDLVRIANAPARLRAFPHELSGGMNQRVMIALALTGEPDLLIADEPTTALDVTTQRQVLDLIRDLQIETGMAMILISHDLGVVASIAQRVAVMYCGRIVEEAATVDLFRHPLHPYTAGLIASMPPDPRLDHPKATRPIPGTVAAFNALPSGCHFHPRCNAVTADCRHNRPPLRAPQANRSVLCHHPLAMETGA